MTTATNHEQPLIADKTQPIVLDVVEFGEGRHPETSTIHVECGQPFRCPCGYEISTVNPWLAAHWSENLKTFCPRCGQKFHMKRGRVRIAKPEVWMK